MRISDWSSDVCSSDLGFRDWSAECTGYAHEVAEMALAHTIENKVERAYRRGDLFDKRRRLMDDWAAFCAIDGAAGANVTPNSQANAGKSFNGHHARGKRTSNGMGPRNSPTPTRYNGDYTDHSQTP